MDSNNIYMKLKSSENLDDNDSLSSYASVNSVNNAENSPIKTQTTRTILSYSDRNRSLLSTEVAITREVNFSPNDQLSRLYTQAPLSSDFLSNSLELHYLVFHNDVPKVKYHIEKLKKKKIKNIRDYLSIKDLHGNTPLHLACMIGNYELVKILVEAGAIVKTRNNQMWTPLNEAISFGNRELIKCTLTKFEKEVEAIVEDSKPKIINALKEMVDFYVEISWDFVSWIPFVSRFLPSDVCKLYKLGTKLRVDCTLGDISHGTSKNGKQAAGSTGGSDSESPANSMGATISPFNWTRGDLTFLFEIEKFGEKNSIIFLDNNKKSFAIIDKNPYEELEHDLDKETDLLLSKEMIFLKLNTKQANFMPTQIGWFSKRDKIEQINGYTCQFYDVSHLYIVTKLRLEHLSDEELKKREEKQTKIKEQLGASSGGKQTNMLSQSESSSSINKTKSSEQLNDLENLKNIDMDEEIEFRPSLPPPPKNTIEWNDYINSKEGECPTLGRKQKCKESKKEFKAQLAMSQEFPLSINDLNKLLDALVPLAKFRKLKEFINLKLPPGFPVKIDIPIVPAISAKVQFQNMQINSSRLIPSLFEVPSNYTEEILFEIPSEVVSSSPTETTTF